MVSLVSKLAQLIAKQEGFGVPGAIPTRQNNPGDLEHAPGESHEGTGAIGSFATPEDGWAALERQLTLYAERGLTVGEAIAAFAPPTENDTASYIGFICQGLGCTPDTPMSDAIQIA